MVTVQAGPVAVCVPLATDSWKFEVPGGGVGVPLMVLPDKVTPPGRLPLVTEKVYVPAPSPPVALRVKGP